MVAALRESDLYEPVKQWLEARGWDVYPEVQPEAYGRRVDIVGLQGPISVAIVEMKTSLTHEVVRQAERWIGNAHYIYIAVPWRKVNWFVAHYLREKRIGLLLVGEDDEGAPAITVHLPARFKRLKERHIKWRNKVCAAHKAGVGGSQSGGHITPYTKMMLEVGGMIENNPQGLTVEQILEYCETHYTRPKPSLSAALLNSEKWCKSTKNSERKTIFKPTRFKDGEWIDAKSCFCGCRFARDIVRVPRHPNMSDIITKNYGKPVSRICTKKEVCDKLVVIETKVGVTNG